MPRGRRTLLQDGYNPKTGTWRDTSTGGKAIAAIRVGNYQKHAALYAGVTPEALQQWLAKGRHHIDQQPDTDTPDITKIPKASRIYVHFVMEVTRARGASVVELTTLMRHAAREDWRAADRLLQLIEPETFLPKTKVEHTGAGGGPIQTHATGVETALGPLLDARAAALAAQN